MIFKLILNITNEIMTNFNLDIGIFQIIIFFFIFLSLKSSRNQNCICTKKHGFLAHTNLHLHASLCIFVHLCASSCIFMHLGASSCILSLIQQPVPTLQTSRTQFVYFQVKKVSPVFKIASYSLKMQNSNLHFQQLVN